MSSPPDGAEPQAPAAPAPPVESGGQAPDAASPVVPPEGSPPPVQPADTVSEMVRVAKAERRAAQARKETDAKAAQLAEVEAKQTKFNGLVTEGKLLDAARVYFPDDTALAQKLFWQLNDYVLSLPDDETKPAPPPTVEEQVAKILDQKLAEERKAAAEKTEQDKLSAAKAQNEQIAEYESKYLGAVREVLAGNLAACPLVSRKFLTTTPEQITKEVTRIAMDLHDAVKALKLPPEEHRARVWAETDPEHVLAVFEESLRRESGGEASAAAASYGEQTLEQITAAAIAAAERGRPMVTISSAAMRGAPPVLAKKPEEMSLDELNAWAIAEATRRRGAPAAG